MMNYSPDLFCKELPVGKINEQLLLDCGIPVFTDRERILHENNISKTSRVARRDIVITNEGTIKCSWYTNKKITNKLFLNHILSLFGSMLKDLKYPKIEKQWIWGSSTSTPHTDIGRDYFYMYLLDTGGDQVKTNWYIEPSFPLERDWRPYLTAMNDTRHLKKVHSTIFKPKTWYYFNSKIIHEVTNMTSTRTAITVRQGVN